MLCGTDPEARFQISFTQGLDVSQVTQRDPICQKYAVFKVLKDNLEVFYPQVQDNLLDWWLQTRRSYTCGGKEGFDKFVIAVAWSLWKQRNAWVFNRTNQQKIVDELQTHYERDQRIEGGWTWCWCAKPFCERVGLGLGVGVGVVVHLRSRCNLIIPKCRESS